jgi:hypothetical protein
VSGPIAPAALRSASTRSEASVFAFSVWRRARFWPSLLRPPRHDVQTTRSCLSCTARLMHILWHWPPQTPHTMGLASARTLRPHPGHSTCPCGRGAATGAGGGGGGSGGIMGASTAPSSSLLGSVGACMMMLAPDTPRLMRSRTIPFQASSEALWSALHGALRVL